MQCPCGYGDFVERIRRSVAHAAPRWFVVDYGGPAPGLGAAPLGTTPRPNAALWGRADVDIHRGAVQKRCKSCARIRYEKSIGGGAVIGGWVVADAVFVLMTDVVDAACAVVQFRGDGAMTESDVEVFEENLPEGAVATVETTTELPFGAVVARYVYRAPIPAGLTGTTRVVVFDRCLGITTPVLVLVH